MGLVVAKGAKHHEALLLDHLREGISSLVTDGGTIIMEGK